MELHWLYKISLSFWSLIGYKISLRIIMPSGTICWYVYLFCGVPNFVFVFFWKCHLNVFILCIWPIHVCEFCIVKTEVFHSIYEQKSTIYGVQRHEPKVHFPLLPPTFWGPSPQWRPRQDAVVVDFAQIGMKKLIC